MTPRLTPPNWRAGAYLTFKHDLVPVFHRFQADSLRNISRTFSAEELKTETTRVPTWPNPTHSARSWTD
jgi:hypothetical protein